MNLLILSPHRDDAAFSVSLAIESWLSAGHHVHVVNVFTQSVYAPYEDCPKAEAEFESVMRISALRKREDEAFVRCLPGLTMSDLDLQDAPLRLKCDTEMVCELPVDTGDAAIAQIAAAIGELCRASGSECALLLPLALGRHVDHRTARDAALPFAQQIPCAFYEDLPYAMRAGVQQDLSCFMEDLHGHVQLNLAPMLGGGPPNASEFKLRMTSLYPSQIDNEMARDIAEFSERYAGAERLWATPAWESVAAAHGLSVVDRDPQEHPLPL